MIVVGIFSLILFFGVVPLALGRLVVLHTTCITDSISQPDIGLEYALGFFTFFAIFTAVCLPVTIAGLPFRVLLYAAWSVAIASTVYFVLRLVHGRNAACYIHALRRVPGWLKKYWYICLPAAVIVYQVCRISIGMTAIYSDDSQYITRINSMITSGRILSHNFMTGEYIADYRFSDPKFLLSSWLQFLSVLTCVSQLHPLIFIKTVIPVFIIPFHYLLVWLISRHVCRSDEQRVCILLFYALLMEFGCAGLRTNFSYYLLSWCWYGKSLLQYAAIPGLFLLFLQLTRENITDWRNTLLLTVLFTAGLGSSTMALLCLTPEFLLLLLIDTLQLRSTKRLWWCLPALLPVAVVLGAYIIIFKL